MCPKFVLECLELPVAPSRGLCGPLESSKRCPHGLPRPTPLTPVTVKSTSKNYSDHQENTFSNIDFLLLWLRMGDLGLIWSQKSTSTAGNLILPH